MSVRATYMIEDLAQCMYGLISKLTTTTSPWTSWSAYLGWPERDILKDFTKPLIYILQPTLTETTWQQGGLSVGRYDLIVGAWDDRKTGGTEEINIISSRILQVFTNPNTCHATQFNVTTDAAYTNTTLITQGVRVDGIVGPRWIAAEDPKEFRVEFTLKLRA